MPLIPDTPVPVQKPTYREKPSSYGGEGQSRPRNDFMPIKKNKTETNTDDIADRIKFREAKTKALRDEQVQEQWAVFESQKSDEEKRVALRKYYTLLYARILKINGSIKKLVSLREAESLKQLDQSRVRPEEYQQASAGH